MTLTFWIAFLTLYVVNLILDFPLQSDFLAREKSNSNYLLFVHCAIWGGGLAIVLLFLGLFAWWKLAMLVVVHFIIDEWKCRKRYKQLGISDWNSLYIDQALHVGQLLICLL